LIKEVDLDNNVISIEPECIIVYDNFMYVYIATQQTQDAIQM